MFNESYVRSKPHLIYGRPAKPEEVIRIKMLEEPVYEQTEFDRWEWTDNGEFEWSRYLDGSLQKYCVDQNDLKNEVATTNFDYDAVLTKLLNFHKVFLIIPTGEIVVM